ncbi:PIN domain-containing protein [Casimicrobium huifangae]|jgi:predicted nucleic acid-binding protein|uniref:PIN domain-containing protein n=1 Tax=Casimicrobium huifangae TaxID=2591109 RepID=UPI0012EB724F|nr:PIN domain-containing protein [Casimicrobium huifangae]
MPVFLDTNILGYLLDSGKKEKIARRLASAQSHVSVQVLNEFIAVCRKAGKDRETAYALADAIANASIVHDITLSTYRLAQALATRYQLSHWDSLIVAAATLAQCETLYSEDLQHGQVIGTVKVVNPFK